MDLEEFRRLRDGQTRFSMYSVSKRDYLEFLVEKGVLEEGDFSEGGNLYRKGVKRIAEFFDDVDEIGNN